MSEVTVGTRTTVLQGLAGSVLLLIGVLLALSDTAVRIGLSDGEGDDDD